LTWRSEGRESKAGRNPTVSELSGRLYCTECTLRRACIVFKLAIVPGRGLDVDQVVKGFLQPRR
jgi:hypothetical protein